MLHAVRLSAFPVLLAGLASLTVACSDDENGQGPTDPAPGETLEVSGDVSAYHEGASGELYSLGDNSTDLALGELASDGTFSFDLRATPDIEGALAHATTDGGFGSDGFYNFVCIDEVIDDIDPDARFAEVRNVQVLVTRDDGSNYPRAIELSTRTEGTGRTGDQPFPGVHQDIHVYWIYADRSTEVQGTCGDDSEASTHSHEVNLSLTAGWNEVILDHRSAAAISQYTGQRPDGVDWYMDPVDNDEGLERFHLLGREDLLHLGKGFARYCRARSRGPMRTRAEDPDGKAPARSRATSSPPSSGPTASEQSTICNSRTRHSEARGGTMKPLRSLPRRDLGDLQGSGTLPQSEERRTTPEGLGALCP